jgi:hypothetical protein
LKPSACIKLVVLSGLAVLLTACRLSVQPPAPAEQNFSPLTKVESPLPLGGDRLDSVNAYHATAHLEERHSRPDGSIFGGIVEYNYYWTRGEGQFSHNEHSVATRYYLESNESVVEESYLVDDLAFASCSSCPVVDERAGGWIVTKRYTGNPPTPPHDVLLGLLGLPLAELIAQSVVIGNEKISGITTTHYRLIDSQFLSDAVNRRIGGAPNSPIELAMAQMDIWLTLGDQRLMHHTFLVEGKAEMVAGTQELQPFTILDHSSVTEINSSITITVPSEVLTAVETQLKALEK